MPPTVRAAAARAATVTPAGPDGQSRHRGSRALEHVLEHAPSGGALALWVAHVDLEADDAPAARTRTAAGLGLRRLQAAPVYVVGDALHYAPEYAALPLAQQTGWLMHAVLHVALRHAARFEALRAELGEVELHLFNLCADAIVNSALGHLRWLALPEGAVRLEDVLARVLQVPDATATALLHWDVERLYRAVDDRRVQAGRDGRTEREDGPRAARMRALGAAQPPDLAPAPTGIADPEAEAARARDWHERLLRAQAGDTPGALLRGLLGDAPGPRTPWELVLRARLNRALSRRPGLSWSRPARSWIALQGRAGPARRLPWTPGVTASRAVPRLAIVLDVSGSVEPGLLRRFGAELDAMLRRLEAGAIVVVGDCAVQQVFRFEPGRTRLEGLAASGGGGTDFAPLLAEAAGHAPELIVVLTDLDGPGGPAPRIPVLWAVPAQAAHRPAPFGRKLVLH